MRATARSLVPPAAKSAFLVDLDDDGQDEVV